MKTKTVVFIRPPNFLLYQEKLQPSLGIMALAAYLRNRKVPVAICDLANEPEKRWEELIPWEYDIYGVTCTTGDYYISCKIAKVIKKNKPEAITVVGGAHPSALPEQALKESCFDMAVIGEGEQTLYEIAINGSMLPDINGVAFKYHKHLDNDIHVATTKPRELFKNLDDLPFPAWDLFHDLVSYDLVEKGEPATCVTGSRGCNQRCAFCDQSLFQGKYRTRSVPNILEEVKQLRDRYKIKEIRFVDELIGVKTKRLKALCEGMERLGIKWRTHMRANHITKEKCWIMADGGCVELAMGVESADQKILNLINKRITIEQAEKAVYNIKAFGMKSKTYWIVGLPGESWESVEKTKKWVKKVNPDRATLSTFIVYPGTDIWKNPNKYKIRIVSKDFKDFWMLGTEWTNRGFVAETEHMTLSDLYKARTDLLRFFIAGGWKDPPPDGYLNKLKETEKRVYS
jgi:radical SAM superfamily enzyme YgiQ (UPF0313 family)